MQTNTQDSYKSRNGQVRVFKNLTRKCYSIQIYLNGYWRTCVHATQVLLKDVNFLVYEKSRLRVLSTKKKTVHAFALGVCIGYQGNIFKPEGLGLPEVQYLQFNNGRRIGYNPYKGPWFYLDGQKIESINFLNMHPDGLYEALQ